MSIATPQITFKYYARFINDAVKINEQRLEEFISFRRKAEADYAQFCAQEVLKTKAQTEEASGMGFNSFEIEVGGGGENRTRVQRSLEASLYKFSSEISSVIACAIR